MNKYKKHNSFDIDEGYNAIELYSKDAILAAWDGCHKIYLAMDEVKADFFRENYDVVLEAFSGYDIADCVKSWFGNSCGLRFVDAVWHNEVDPNAGFVTLIAQGAISAKDRDD
jgi:hypothetical protein